MATVTSAVDAFMKKSEEELISMLQPGAGGNQAELIQHILELRRGRTQAEAAKALLQATDKQAASGAALVMATGSLVHATRRLAWGTFALVGMTFFLVLAGAVQTYVSAQAAPVSVWVLWYAPETPGPNIPASAWRPMDAHDGKRTCEASMKQLGGPASGNTYMICLPDTVDPRGPKGK